MRLFWGTVWLAAAVVVALLPGELTGPRIGMVAMSAMLGLTLIGLGILPLVVRSDSSGSCPVGWACQCGTFNMKVRTTCRTCGADETQAEARFEPTGNG